MKNLQVNLYFFARKIGSLSIGWTNTFSFFPTVTFKYFKSKTSVVQNSLTFSFFSDRN